MACDWWMTPEGALCEAVWRCKQYRRRYWVAQSERSSLMRLRVLTDRAYSRGRVMPAEVRVSWKVNEWDEGRAVVEVREHFGVIWSEVARA